MSYPQRGEKGYLSLEGGLVTESSPLSSPEGTTADELNMAIDITSLVRKRRLGLSQLASSTDYSGEINLAFHWVSARYLVLFGISDNEDESLANVDIFFFDQDDYSLQHRYYFEVLLENAGLASASEIRSRMVCTFGTAPAMFQKESSGKLSCYKNDVHVRDFKLVEDGLQADERPVSLSDEHKYNILNAGWYQRVYNPDGNPDLADNVFFNAINSYPSNSDYVSLGFQSFPDTGVTYFNGDEYFTPQNGNTVTARGHYVYNIRTINRQARQSSRSVDGTGAAVPVALLLDGVNQGVGGVSGNLLFTDTPTAGAPVDNYLPPFRYKPGTITPVP